MESIRLYLRLIWLKVCIDFTDLRVILVMLKLKYLRWQLHK
jgi:hypothetical protein